MCVCVCMCEWMSPCCDFGSNRYSVTATWGPFHKSDLFGASYPRNDGGRWTRESRSDSAARLERRGTCFFAREERPSRHRETVLVATLCVGRGGPGSFRKPVPRAGRSASLLGPACRVRDHPARINPSSVLGVTAERFTRLYIFIPLFPVRSSARAKLSAFESARFAKYYYYEKPLSPGDPFAIEGLRLFPK